MSDRKVALIQQWQEILNKVQKNQAHLVVVSKHQPVDEIKIVYEAGQRDFGENKVQDLEEKAEALIKICPEIRWHLIGHLQSNKINKLKKIKNVSAIHSVDSLELLKKINSAWDEPCDLFIQVNTAHEDEKSGVESLNELSEILHWIEANPHEALKLRGLMCMGPLRCEDHLLGARLAFNELKKLRSHFPKLNLELSMGMSQDYELALELGSQWVRVGSKIFRHDIK